MMKFASEMNAIATKMQMGKEAKKLNVAHAYADNDLAVEMEEIAKKGGRSMWVKKPKKVKWKYVRAYLEQNDFKVFGLFNLCRISW